MRKKLKSPAKLDALAMHIATGNSIPDFAKEHGIALRTAYDWSVTQDVKDRIVAIRSRLIDQGVGKLIGTIRKATHELDRLIENGSTDSVRLAAARGVISDTMALCDFADLERRVAALEEGRGYATYQRLDEPNLPT